MHTMARSISSSGRRRSTSVLSPASWPSRSGPIRQESVGAHERGEDSGATGEGGRDQGAVDLAEPNADPVVDSARGADLARHGCAGRTPLGRRGALELGKQRADDEVEGQRRRDRIAGHSHDRRAADDAEYDGMPGLDGDAVHGQHAGGGDHGGGVIVADPRRNPARTSTTSASPEARSSVSRSAAGSSETIGPTLNCGTRLAGLAGEHQRVGVGGSHRSPVERHDHESRRRWARSSRAAGRVPGAPRVRPPRRQPRRSAGCDDPARAAARSR